MKKVFRELSRQQFEGESTIEAVNCGSLQRIADAVEKVAVGYDRLQQDRDLYKRWYLEKKAEAERLARSNVALRGQITKLQRKNGEKS